MLDHESASNLPEWITKLSDEEKHELIAQIADSIQSPAQASGKQKSSVARRLRKKQVVGIKSIPAHIQKYVRPLREKTDLEALKLEQGYTGTNWEQFDKLVKELNIKEPIELLLSQLTR